MSAVWSRAIVFTGLILAIISLPGCLIIPTNYYTAASRKNIAEEQPETIIPGKTSREEVLLILGEPDAASPDEMVLWYDAEKVKAWLILGQNGDYIIRHYLLVIHFDGKGVVDSQRMEVMSNTGLESNFEPHFSKPPITLPVKSD